MEAGSGWAGPGLIITEAAAAARPTHVISHSTALVWFGYFQIITSRAIYMRVVIINSNMSQLECQCQCYNMHSQSLRFLQI